MVNQALTLIALLILGIPALSLAAAQDPAPQEQQCMAKGWKLLTPNIGGITRRLLWKGPAGIWSKGAIIVLHGGGGSHFQWCVANASITEPQVAFSNLAISRGYAVFTLDSTAQVTDNDQQVCGKVWDDEVRARPNLDLPFIEYVAKSLIPSVRPTGSWSTLYMTGLSSGGFMALRASTRLDNTIRAFAPASGGDPYGWHRICDPNLATRDNVYGAGFDNETNRAMSATNACLTSFYRNEAPWDSSAPVKKPNFKQFYHRYDGVIDYTCAEKAGKQLRAHGYPDAGAFVLRDNATRSEANHFWSQKYNAPILDFFATQKPR